MNWGGAFRVSRWVHGYLSAFAFLSLMFFSVTGILLNHPEWIRSVRDAGTTVQATLAPQALSAAKAAPDPARALAAAVGRAVPLVGAYRSGDVSGDEAILRLEGTKGSSDVDVNLATGRVEATLRRSSPLVLFDKLHQGRDSGAAWKLFIDLSAVVFMLTSLIGYVLFFSLRFRLIPSLIVTAASLALMGALVWFLAT